MESSVTYFDLLGILGRLSKKQLDKSITVVLPDGEYSGIQAMYSSIENSPFKEDAECVIDSGTLLLVVNGYVPEV